MSKGAKIDVQHAIISGPLNLQYAVFKKEFSLQNCHLLGPADFSYSTFKQSLDLSNSAFHAGAEFDNATLNYDGTLDGAKFRAGEASFIDFQVRGLFSAERVNFLKEVTANFERACFEKSALFRGTRFHQVSFNGAKIKGDAKFGIDRKAEVPAASFEGEADFVGIAIGGEADFEDTHFSAADTLISFEGARIGGPALFQKADFAGQLMFLDVHIRRAAHYSGAVFWQSATFTVEIDGSAYFLGVEFKEEANFNGAKIHGDVFFDPDPDGNLLRTKFAGTADFGGVEIDGQFSAQGALFKRSVNFNAAKIGADLIFRADPEEDLPAAVFESEAEFDWIEVGGQADFRGARFDAPDDLVSFDGARITQDVLFKGVAFGGKVDFVGAQISGQASFQGAVFEQDVSFNGIRIESDASFSSDDEEKLPPATFGGEVDFVGAAIGGESDFEGVSFYSRDKPASFESAKFDGDAFFNQAQFFGKTSFEDGQFGGIALFRDSCFLRELSFSGAQFRQGAFFQGARFKEAVDFGTAQFFVEAHFHGATFTKEARFDASRFTGLAQFNAGEDLLGAVFNNEVSFEHARFEHDVRFDDAVFRGNTNYREASFLAVYFSPNGQAQGQSQFQGSVDLRGCIYERIQVNEQLLLKRLVGTVDPDKYDRQPYTQLEKVLRAVGQDRQADDVYLERRRVEHKQKRQRGEIGSWLLDSLHALFANYGVRPYQLLYIPVLLIFLGIGIFSAPSAVLPKDANEPNQTATPIVLLPWDAFRVSLREFLPVELPMASQWIPSEDAVDVQVWLPWHTRTFKMRPSTFAAFFLRLAGWILVPLGIAALTGLLRRVAP